MLAWQSLDDPHALEEALEGITTLSQLLEDERRAVAALDPAGLHALAAQKGPLIERLRALAHLSPINLQVATTVEREAQRQRREQVRLAAVSLLAQAEANAALLGDAIHAISAALGYEQDDGVYDARARVQRRSRAFARKRA